MHFKTVLTTRWLTDVLSNVKATSTAVLAFIRQGNTWSVKRTDCDGRRSNDDQHLLLRMNIPPITRIRWTSVVQCNVKSFYQKIKIWHVDYEIKKRLSIWVINSTDLLKIRNGTHPYERLTESYTLIRSKMLIHWVMKHNYCFFLATAMMTLFGTIFIGREKKVKVKDLRVFNNNLYVLL